MEVAKSKVKTCLPTGKRPKVFFKRFDIDEYPVWLKASHPNYIRWKRGRDLSLYRGELVESILKKNSVCTSLNILDLGSGEGGTVKVFSENNFVVSYDINLFRLKNQINGNKVSTKLNADALHLPFKKILFDVIILQDVIEHISNNENLSNKLDAILKDDGLIFISTPNKLSIFNIVSDPHWGVPLLSIMKRENIKKYFLRIFRKDEIFRKDIAQLLSLNEIKKIFSEKYFIQLNTIHTVKKLFEGHKGIIWSNFHLRLIKIIKILKLNFIINKIANNKFGIINKFFNPTFYLVLRKKNKQAL
ncbi:MAG: methyltransferase domain-containing protein [Ignavibacteriaceae bacterium]